MLKIGVNYGKSRACAAFGDVGGGGKNVYIAGEVAIIAVFIVRGDEGELEGTTTHDEGGWSGGGGEKLYSGGKTGNYRLHRRERRRHQGAFRQISSL